LKGLPYNYHREKKRGKTYLPGARVVGDVEGETITWGKKEGGGGEY